MLVFLKGFSPVERSKLGKVTAILLAGGQIPPSVLSKVLQDHLVKDGNLFKNILYLNKFIS